nr:PREDICTED: protein tilB homolog [Bemisia tabaci]
MVLITEELLRKRAEHNEKEICTLEEVSLHQESITKIEHIDKWCRELKILLLQSNLISKIENVGRLKLLEYLNLALNNIEVIENLQGCEMLQKLDLTLNFIGDIESVRSLQHNEHLESLFMTGNPCAEYPGYREFVIATLPQLKQLDGTQIFRSERITAVQKLDGIMEGLILHQKAHKEKREKQKRELMSNTQTHNDNIDETDPEENSRFWNKKSENTPETRIEIAEHTRRAQKARQSSEPEPKKRVLKFFKADGTPYNINEAKIPFLLESDEETNSIILKVEVYKYLDTSLIEIDVQPKYVRLTVKGKTLQLSLSEEVKTDDAVALRSQVTGFLTITMPKTLRMIPLEISSSEKDLP